MCNHNKMKIYDQIRAQMPGAIAYEDSSVSCGRRYSLRSGSFCLSLWCPVSFIQQRTQNSLLPFRKTIPLRKSRKFSRVPIKRRMLPYLQTQAMFTASVESNKKTQICQINFLCAKKRPYYLCFPVNVGSPWYAPID